MWAKAAQDIGGTLVLAALASVLASRLPFPFTFVGFYLLFMTGCTVYFRWQKFEFPRINALDRFSILCVFLAFACTLLIHVLLVVCAKFYALQYPITTPLFERLWRETPFLFLLFSVFIGPIFEELWFRGVILQRLAKTGIWSAAILTQVLFALVHFPYIVPAFLLSMPLLVLALRRRLYEAISAHILWNSWYLLVAMEGFN